MVARTANPEVDKLIGFGDQHFQVGDLVTARLFYVAAADFGSPTGAVKTGMTYDPLVVEKTRTNPAQINPDRALRWYEKGVEGGAPDAQTRLNELRAWIERQ